MTRNILFDYSSLPDDKASQVRAHANAITTQTRHSSRGVIAIGQALIDVKSVIGRGNFKAWVKAEFEWDYATATRFMRCASRFGHVDCAEWIQPSAMIALAQKSTPDGAVAEGLSLAMSGTTVSKRMAVEIVARHRLRPVKDRSEVESKLASKLKSRWWLSEQKRMFVTALEEFRNSVSSVRQMAMSDDERSVLAQQLLAIASQLKAVESSTVERPELVPA